MRSPFLRPAAYLVASNEASAPPASLAVNTTASSTVTGPVPDPSGQRPLAGERGADRGHAGDLVAGQVMGQVDDVRAEVAERARPGALGLHPPGHRGVRVDEPVLQVDGPDVAQRAEAAVSTSCRASARAGTRR